MIIKDCIEYATKTIIFKVYVGDRKGEGRATKIGTFQRNLKAKGYEEFFKGQDVKFKGDFIIITK